MILIQFFGWLYITCSFSINLTESRYLSRPVDLNFGPKNGQNQDIWSKSTAQGLKIWQPISPVPGLKSRLHSYVPEFWRLISFLCISRLKKKLCSKPECGQVIWTFISGPKWLKSVNLVNIDGSRSIIRILNWVWTTLNIECISLVAFLFT